MGAESTRLVEWVEWAAEWDDDVADPNSPPALSPPPLVASAEEETAGGCCCCCCGWGKRPGRNVPTSPLVPTPRNRCCCCCCCWPGCPPLCTGSPTEDEASASSGNKSRHYYNYNQKPSPPQKNGLFDLQHKPFFFYFRAEFEISAGNNQAGKKEEDKRNKTIINTKEK